jgi:fructose-1,6-bisphosphatase/inositol monophosphatase family enzyme
MSDNLPATLPKPVSTAQQQNILNIVRRTARAEILPRFRNLQTGDVSVKSRPDDLVTAADKAAEAMITRALSVSFPGALVVGEESVAEDPGLLGQIADAPLAFIIDPIDGTWNFAHGIAVFGVILAVTQFGRPAFGLIYDPVADDWAITDDDTEPRFENARGTSRLLKTATGRPVEELTGFIPLQMFPKDKQARLAATFPGFARTDAMRCSAHEYRMIAQGYADFVLTPSLFPWDHAAGVLICERAGGHAEMLDGTPYTAGRHEGHLLVASDHLTWNRLQKVFSFMNERPA